MFQRHAATIASLAIAAMLCVLYWPAPTGRTAALLACEGCELSEAEIDRLIGEARDLNDPNMSRQLWEHTYSDPAKLEAARKLCGPCVEAIIQAGTAFDN